MNITAFQVKKRRPYYIQCSGCENMISDWSVEEVVKTANGEEWQYITATDEILCKECIEDLKKEGK